VDQPKSKDRKIAPETILQVAEEWLGTPLAEADRKPVAQMLDSLMRDMAKMRAMDVGVAEPAPVYQP
jgi:hypothetical protein